MKTTVENWNHARSVSKWDIRIGSNILGNLQSRFIIDDQIGPTHAELSVCNLDLLFPTVVHDFFQIIVIEKKLQVAMWIGFGNPVYMVNWRGVVAFSVNRHSSVLL